MNPVAAWRDRRRRIAAAEAELRKQERIGEAITFYADEAAEIGTWARDRLEANHLTQLFKRTVR